VLHETTPTSSTTAGPAPDGAQQGAARRPARRSVMAIGATVALGAAGTAALAGCGSSSSAGSSTPAGGAGASSPAAPTAGKALAKLADVPVGGALVAAGADGTSSIVIAQPTAGKVVAFSARCTHQGCKVLVNKDKLDCPCHGSVFDAMTGKNLTGPAPSPLAAVAVAVSGTDVVSA